MPRGKPLNLSTSPSVLILHEKEGDRYFEALSAASLHNSALSILRGRLEAGWYDERADAQFALDAKRVIKKRDGSEAWNLLQDRLFYEYEGVSLSVLELKYETQDVKETDDE